MLFMENPNIIALIPAYNEEETIGNVINNTIKYVSKIIVINDGSTDKTKEIALSHGAEVVDNIINRGLGLTMKKGYQEALKRKADIIIQLDADGQYLAEEIPLLLKPIIDNEADLVLGSRLENIQYQMPLIKKFGNMSFSKILKFLTNADVADGQTGFRAIRKHVLETSMPEGKYTYTQEMIIKAAEDGWRIKSIPITFCERISGPSRLISHPFSYAINAWLIIIRTMRDYHPLAFFGIPGLIMIIFGLILGSSLVYRMANLGFIGKTPSIILTALLIIVGVQMIHGALIADMIRKKNY